MIASDPQFYIDGVLEGNRRALAKTITIVESSLPAHEHLSRSILEGLLPYSGNSVRVGITGVPGVGKSTFIESFGMFLIGRGHRLAVLAVDPSSSRSGGSVLADKTRMEKLSAHPDAFIRPSPSGGSLGGVARKTRETLLVCEAAGYDVTIVETVGVGQSETTVASMVDFFLVLMLAGAGDELQGIKKGVLELADAIAITKADGDNVENALRARREYESALRLLVSCSPLWAPPVLTCSALGQTGIDTIWERILAHRKTLQEAGELEAKRRQQAVQWFWALLREGLKTAFFGHPEVKRRLPGITREVQSGRTPATIAAEELLHMADAKGEPGSVLPC